MNIGNILKVIIDFSDITWSVIHTKKFSTHIQTHINPQLLKGKIYYFCLLKSGYNYCNEEVRWLGGHLCIFIFQYWYFSFELVKDFGKVKHANSEVYDSGPFTLKSQVKEAL